MYDFDRVIDRNNTYSIKYAHQKRDMPKDILPLWVADMDFQAPPCVLEALEAQCRHGIFGYSEPDDTYISALQSWYSRRHDWNMSPEWLVVTPGVVFALATAVRAFTAPGDAIIIQQPVYYPFSAVVSGNDRKLVVSELLNQDGRYTVDFERFEQQIVENNVKLFILCSPHNPVGRVWTREELTRMGDICIRNGVLVIADEIHADFVFPGFRHTVFASLGEEYNKITVTCTAPSKTFNLAGLQISNILIADKTLRDRFRREMNLAGYSQPNVMGIAACAAAYREGAPWLTELLAYLKGNLDAVRGILRERLPQVRLVEPEGTYLIWLDFRALNLDDAELNRRLIHEAGVWLDEGTMFGAGGVGFQRINIACPRSTLLRAMEQIIQVL